MDLEEIKELVRLMVANDLAELDITEGEDKIRLKRGTSGEAVVAPAPPPVAPAAPEAPPVEEEFTEIKSPMVGTFYAGASPDSDPYIAVGSEVQEDTVVCILEAMKVMNEIKAECTGRIGEVCVRDAQPVEYGQVLFRVKPS